VAGCAVGYGAAGCVLAGLVSPLRVVTGPPRHVVVISLIFVYVCTVGLAFWALSYLFGGRH
jgi:hypothetical protein